MKTKKTDTTQKTPKTELAGAPPALTQADIQTCLDHAQAIATVLAPYAVTLTSAQRRAQTKFRKEGGSVIPTLARLATASGLASAALNVVTMQQQVELANTLLPLLTTVKTLSDTIGDTVLSAHGDSWHTATTLHSALVRVAKGNPALRRDMEVVSSAFTRRKKPTAQAAAARTATTNVATTNVATTNVAAATPTAPTEPTAPDAPAATTTPVAPIKGA
jgi:hypothetical protein